MILDLKEPGILVEMVDSRSGKGEVKMVLEYSAPESKKMLKKIKKFSPSFISLMNCMVFFDY